jgi:hypothetical protein
MELILLGLMGVMVLGVIGAVVWLIARRPRGSGDPNLMACGACGYAVRGVQTTSCPECGADLREVGIARPRTAGGNAAWWVVLIAVIAIVGLFMVCCVGGLFISYDTLQTPPAPPTMPAPQPTPAPNDGTLQEANP